MGKQIVLHAMADVAWLISVYSSKPRQAIAHLPARHPRERGFLLLLFPNQPSIFIGFNSQCIVVFI